MAKLADAADLKSAGANPPWGFKSPSGHHVKYLLVAVLVAVRPVVAILSTTDCVCSGERVRVPSAHRDRLVTRGFLKVFHARARHGEPGTKCLAAGVERRPRDLRVVEYRGEPRFVLKVLLGGAPEDSTRLSLTGKLHGPDRIQSIGIQSNSARIPVFRLRQLDRAAIAIHLRPFSGVKLAGSQSASRRWPAHRVPVWGIDRSGHMQTPICHKRSGRSPMDPPG